MTLFYLLFPFRTKKTSFIDSRSLLVKDTPEIMAQFGRREQHSAKFGQSRFVTATQLKYRVWIASGVKKKVVSEILRKDGVCVCVFVK